MLMIGWHRLEVPLVPTIRIWLFPFRPFKELFWNIFLWTLFEGYWKAPSTNESNVTDQAFFTVNFMTVVSHLSLLVTPFHFISFSFRNLFPKKKKFETLIVGEKICEKFIDLLSSKLLTRKFVDTKFCTVTFTITLI